MKKILSTLAIAMTFASVASADFARIEMGAGAWMQTPSGDIGYTGTAGGFNDVSSETAQTTAYAWLLIKHPIPVLPNLRLEYANAINEGSFIGTLAGVSIPTGAATNLEMTQYDIVPYYNLLDNTAWITLDVGLDVKVVQLGYTAAGEDVIAATGVDIAGLVLPLGYARVRVQAPLMNFGAEADVKYISYNGNTVSDIRVKADYTFGFIPVIQPAIEIGYRMQKFDISESGFSIKTDYAGVYAGVMVRF